jgi:mono/diheme cytochrome c family protein
MKRLVKCSVLFATLSLCAGFALRSSQAGAERSETVASAQAVQAAKLFDEKCARCHGLDGRGHTVIGGMLGAPDFTDENWWGAEKSERRFVHSITDGREEMPAFGKKLSRREITALAAYVTGFRKKTAR